MLFIDEDFSSKINYLKQVFVYRKPGTKRTDNVKFFKFFLRCDKFKLIRNDVFVSIKKKDSKRF